MLCILYVIALGTCLGAAAALAEPALPARWPRRWLWCAVVALTIVIPGTFRARHNAPVDDALGAAWWQHTTTWDATINRVWLLASGALVLWGLAHAAHVAWSARRRGPAPAVVDGVPVVVTPALGPATVGLWRARIVVPRWVLALPGPQRRYVLRHEDEHRRSRDALLLFAASLAVVLTPWNLALYWQLRRLRLAVEMDCDARVVRALGDAPAYGALLLDIAQAASRAPRPRRLQPAFLGGADSLEARLRRLVGPARPRGAARVLAPLAAAFLLLLALTVPHPVLARDAARAASAPHAHGR
jgi:hypothetical protein